MSDSTFEIVHADDRDAQTRERNLHLVARVHAAIAASSSRPRVVLTERDILQSLLDAARKGIKQSCCSDAVQKDVLEQALVNPSAEPDSNQGPVKLFDLRAADVQMDQRLLEGYGELLG
jgi:hypothetical protein